MPESAERGEPESRSVPALVSRVPRLGVFSWSFVGFVVAVGIVVTAFAAVSEIMLPLTFAAVLAVMFKPLSVAIERRGLRPTLAAGVVIIGLLALMVGVVVATARGVVDQADKISAVADDAVETAAGHTEDLGVGASALADLRRAIEGSAFLVTVGAVTDLVSGVGTLVGLASGLILGALIMYYLLKDGSRLRRSLVGQVHPEFRDELDSFIGDACVILRGYGRGRTVLSAVVAVVVGLAALLLGLPLVFTIMVVNFVGGYIPYLGAFLGGGLAVIVALGSGGITDAVIMLIVVLAANLALENFVEPKVMGRTLAIHPVVVLVVTALGGLLGGIVGLILAVPATVITGNAVGRLRSRGVLDRAAARAQPAVKHMLERT